MSQSGAAGAVATYPPFARAGVDTRSNAAYGTLATPDEIDNISIKSAGTLLLILYEALWVPDATNPVNGRAALFIGGQQLQSVPLNGASAVQEAVGFGGNGFYVPLGTYSGGLISNSQANPTGNSGDPPTTPYVIPVPQSQGPAQSGLCVIRGLAPGTISVSVQFRSTDAGQIFVKDRRLWVATLG